MASPFQGELPLKFCNHDEEFLTFLKLARHRSGESCFTEHNWCGTDTSKGFITLLIQVSNVGPSMVRNKSAEKEEKKKHQAGLRAGSTDSSGHL